MRIRRRGSAQVCCVLLMTFAISALGTAAQAQTCHPLEGTWRLSARASVDVRSLAFNPYYRVRAVALRLRASAGRVYEDWAFRGPHLREHWSFSFEPNGRSYRTHTHSKLYSVPTSVIATWQNCTLIVDGGSRLFGQRIITTSTYVFSPDGKTLTIRQSIDSPIMHTVRQLVFRRQPQRHTAARDPSHTPQAGK